MSKDEENNIPQDGEENQAPKSHDESQESTDSAAEQDASIGDDGNGSHGEEGIVGLSGLYEEWFLDYASYVILERAVPAMDDGLKPVQRRILHSLKEMDDGRYNKVANVIGNTMKYHPHGDASIGDAMVQIGQKDLLIDCQGNWGNILTGDRAAAPRYIEARLTKFALHAAFNPKTTEWMSSYDGRNKEPVNLPIKFPLLLAQGAEGIAVGMACKILPHNFNEIIDGCINTIKGKKVSLVPDFPQGGMADFSGYNDGLRGGRVRVRARIRKEDNKTLVIHEIPFGTTTSSLIDSILKANDKGKIKIKKVEDNTAAEVEIMIHLATGVSPDKTIDALYAFTDCEVSISPNAAVIENDSPRFAGVSEMLKHSVEHTKELLKLELEIRKGELESHWHFSSLEKIFIENRIYRLIEEEETWEGVMAAIHKGLKPFLKMLRRPVTDDDVVRLTEIKIKRISKYDSFKADEAIKRIEEELENIEYKLGHLDEHAIEYYKDLKEKFGKGRERKTEERAFDTIAATKVIIRNKKLYVDPEEGFIGYSLKGVEAVGECSEIDDVICFFEDGRMMVTKVADKKFVGKGLIYANIWKKGDKRTIYHMIYRDGNGGAAFVKRFAVNSITRDKEYDLTKGSKGSKVHYFTVNPNGEREVVTVTLRNRPGLRRNKLEVDFGELLIKGRGAGGNRVTKEAVTKVTQQEVGGSTLAARKVWWDDTVRRLNDEGRGKFLGNFKGDDHILTIYKSGEFMLSPLNLAKRFDDDMIHIEKLDADRPLSVVYWEGDKKRYYVKRFTAEGPDDKRVNFIGEHEESVLQVVSTAKEPMINIIYNKHLKATKHLPDKQENLAEFIDVKGLKAQGNMLTKLAVKDIELMHPIEGNPEPRKDDDGGPDDEESTDPNETTEVEAAEKPEKEPAKAEEPKPEPEPKKADKSEKKASEPEKVEGSTAEDKPVEVEFDLKPAKKKSAIRPAGGEEDPEQMSLF